MNLMHIESAVVCVALFLILLIYHIKYEYRERNELKLVYFFSIFCAIAGEMRVFFIGDSLLSMFLHVIYVGCLGMVGAMWSQYCYMKYGYSFENNCAFKWLKYAPVLAAIFLTIYSTEMSNLSNVAQNQGNLHRIYGGATAVLCLYAIFVWVMALLKMKQTKSERKRSDIFFPVIVSTIPVLVGCIQFVLPFGLPLVSLSSAVSLLIFKVHTLYRTMRIDNLTKLPNRYGMEDEIREELEEYRKNKNDLFYIIACDMDRFKQINDTWGHPEGDRALELISETLDRVAQECEATAFRVGGDEFVIIVDASEDTIPKRICEQIKQKLDTLEFRDDFDICMSMGIAKYDGTVDVAELLNRADKELYEVKRKEK